MKYSFVLAGLVASAIATPYVNVEVSDDSLPTSHHNHREHGLRHRNGRQHGHNNEHWWSSLFGTSQSRSNRHRNHRGNNVGRDGSDDGDDDGDMDNLYECILTARHNGDERKNTRECCNQQGGELYDTSGHCIFRDVMMDPENEWRQCAMDNRGTEFAACYRREQREIDDELAGRLGHEHRSRHDRNHRNNHHNRMSVSGGDDDNNNDGNDGDDNDGDDHRHRKHRNNDHFECRVDMADEMRRQQIMHICCEEDVQGRIDQNNQVCRIRNGDDREEFEQCAMAEGAENAECYRQ